MVQTKITYNPYKVQTKILVDGEEPKTNSRLVQYLKERIQLWVDQIPFLLAEEYNEDEFELTFHGTELDYQDLMAAIRLAEENGIHFIVNKLPAKEYGDKERDIRELFSKIQQLPFEELRSPAVTNAFESAFNELLEVNVVATMSAGKSTLINALLGKKLMPSKQGACTATITRIQDDDEAIYKAVAYDQYKSEVAHCPDLDYKTMISLNKNEDVSVIQVSGDIPFVTADEVSLVLIDTPGPDNARDPQHGKVTAEALDRSSKMLVMFVMNGGKLHDEAQDNLLRRIAKSMSVGGKQSKERFLFVINKMDGYDEEDDDIEGETIPDTVRYLEEMGIENPNIFPAAAEPALMIRRYQNTFDEDERKELYDKILPVAHKLIKQEQLHLERYPHLSLGCRMAIEAELDQAVEENDILGQALVHSGIRGIEETIRMYVTKYCRPAKIRNVVDTFESKLKAAEAFVKTKEMISSREGDLKKVGREIESLNKKLSSKTENEKFKQRLRGLDIRSQLEGTLDVLCQDVVRDLMAFLRNAPAEIDREDAMGYIRRFKSLADSKQNEFQVNVEKLLDSNLKEKSNQLLQEYIERLNTISDEFNGKGLKIDLESYAKGELTQLDANSILKDSFDSRTETHIEKRSRQVTRRREGLDRLLHISSWFNPEYTVTEYYNEKKDNEIKFVSRQKLMNKIIPPIEKKLREERDKALNYAKKETRSVIKFFEEQFDNVDEILYGKMKELEKATASRESARQALKEANQLLENLGKIDVELNRILEI